MCHISKCHSSQNVSHPSAAAARALSSGIRAAKDVFIVWATASSSSPTAATACVTTLWLTAESWVSSLASMNMSRPGNSVPRVSIHLACSKNCDPHFTAGKPPSFLALHVLRTSEGNTPRCVYCLRNNTHTRAHSSDESSHDSPWITARWPYRECSQTTRQHGGTSVVVQGVAGQKEAWNKYNGILSAQPPLAMLWLEESYPSPNCARFCPSLEQIYGTFSCFWFVWFGLLCSHTASTPITAGTCTSGAQYKGSPQNPDQIERHSRNGP